MAEFTVSIPDELLPALVAEFTVVKSGGGTDAADPAEYFVASVVEIIRQRAELYKVGPYYVGPINPAFNPDGSPFGSEAPPEPETPPEEEPQP